MGECLCVRRKIHIILRCPILGYQVGLVVKNPDHPDANILSLQLNAAAYRLGNIVFVILLITKCFEARMSAKQY